MKRVILHSKKVIRNHWFIICIAGAVSFVYGIIAFLTFLIYSMNFTEDPVDVNDIMEEFTEEELGIVLADTMDENVSDEEYFTLLARYQSYFCPKKVDRVTTWVGSEVTEDSYIMSYEIKKEIEGFSADKLKDNILKEINPNCVQTIRLVRSGKNMVFRYTNTSTYDSFDIVITPNDLKA